MDLDWIDSRDYFLFQFLAQLSSNYQINWKYWIFSALNEDKEELEQFAVSEIVVVQELYFCFKTDSQNGMKFLEFIYHSNWMLARSLDF